MPEKKTPNGQIQDVYTYTCEYKKKWSDHLKFYWSIHKDDNPLINVNKVVALFLLTEKMFSRKYRAKILWQLLKLFFVFINNLQTNRQSFGLFKKNQIMAN